MAMSLRAVSILTGIAWFCSGWICAAQQEPSGSPQSPGSEYRTILNRYCVTCHNEKLKVAALSLDGADVENPSASAEVWEKVIRKLRTRAMPPVGAPRPDAAAYNSLATYLETAIDRAAAAHPNPGRPDIHRLNRAEYVNAIRDLLGVDVDGESFLPADDSGYGFDNIGAALTVSPTLLERYMSAARKISRLAIPDAVVPPSVQIYEAPLYQLQAERMDGLPFGSRGGVLFTHDFPADGEYTIKIRLIRDGYIPRDRGAPIRGVNLRRQIDLRLDDTRLTLFTVGAEQKASQSLIMVNAQNGELGMNTSEYEKQADAHLEIRVPVTAGPHKIGVSFVAAQNSVPEGVFRPRVLGSNSALAGGKTAEPWVDSVAISGPYEARGLGEPPSHRKIFVCHPSATPSVAGGDVGSSEEDACAKTILSTLGRLAYRRTIRDADTEALLAFYRMGRKQGSFEDGIRMAIERMLVSVDFLFRVEFDPPNVASNANYRISDLELASRLSFFLWSSIPDDQLLNLAERGKLGNAEVLEQQVRRMLRDPRSEAFLKNFFGQWLRLRRVPGLTPDPGEYRDFDEDLRQAFQKETELWLESMLKEDRPLMDLLDSNYTFLNERLALNYGIPNIYGNHFRRVTVADDNRRGLLGQGSILTLTSYATRTSVVLRGVWVLDNILGTPPPPPPPNVPALIDRGGDGKIKSVRQSMEEHRANAVCASCHSRIDPIGFALENFDGIGRWRTTEGSGNTPIDTSGMLPDGTEFQSPAELRKVLMRDPEQFATVVTTKLLTFALGRGVEYYDAPAVRKIVHESAPDDYRWSSLFLGIVRSEPFQMRRSLQQ
jgi:hypothetical protein